MEENLREASLTFCMILWVVQPFTETFRKGNVYFLHDFVGGVPFWRKSPRGVCLVFFVWFRGRRALCRIFARGLLPTFCVISWAVHPFGENPWAGMSPTFSVFSYAVYPFGYNFRKGYVSYFFGDFVGGVPFCRKSPKGVCILIFA